MVWLGVCEISEKLYSALGLWATPGVVEVRVDEAHSVGVRLVFDDANR
jgi:hypothetical protein